MNSDAKSVGDSDGARVKVDKDLASALMEEEGEEEESEAEAGESRTTVLATDFEGGCKSSDHTGSEFEHSEPSPSTKWGEPWLPYREKPAEEEGEGENAPAAIPWLPEPALLPPPPPPRPPREVTAVRPPVPYRPQLYAFSQCAPPPPPSTEKTGARAALPAGPMMYPTPPIGIPMQMTSWALSSAPLYPNLAMATAVPGPLPQQQHLHSQQQQQQQRWRQHQMLQQQRQLQQHHQRRQLHHHQQQQQLKRQQQRQQQQQQLRQQQQQQQQQYRQQQQQQQQQRQQQQQQQQQPQPPPQQQQQQQHPQHQQQHQQQQLLLQHKPSRHPHEPRPNPQDPLPHNTHASTNFSTGVSPTGSTTIRATAQQTNQWPPAQPKQPGGGSPLPTPIRRVAKRARPQAPAGGTEALLKELLSTPVTKSSTRWTDEDIHGRPREKAKVAAVAAPASGVLSGAGGGTATTIARPPPLSPVLRDEGSTAMSEASVGAGAGGAAASGPSACGAAAAAASMVNSAAAAAAAVTAVSVEPGSTAVVSDLSAGARPAVLDLGVGSVEAAAVELPPPLASFDMNGDDNSHPIQVHSGGGADFYRLGGR